MVWGYCGPIFCLYLNFLLENVTQHWDQEAESQSRLSAASLLLPSPPKPHPHRGGAAPRPPKHKPERKQQQGRFHGLISELKLHHDRFQDVRISAQDFELLLAELRRQRKWIQWLDWTAAASACLRKTSIISLFPHHCIFSDVGTADISPHQLSDDRAVVTH